MICISLYQQLLVLQFMKQQTWRNYFLKSAYQQLKQTQKNKHKWITFWSPRASPPSPRGVCAPRYGSLPGAAADSGYPAPPARSVMPPSSAYGRWKTRYWNSKIKEYNACYLPRTVFWNELHSKWLHVGLLYSIVVHLQHLNYNGLEFR